LRTTSASTRDTVFDYERLRALKLHESPYRYVVHDSTILNPKLLNTLCEKFPQTDNVGHTNVNDVRLCDEWRAFVTEINSRAYRSAIEEITGLSLSQYETGIGLRHSSKKSHGTPHSDVPRKKVTHLMYFNKEWPHETGRLRVLRSKSLDDVHEVVHPVNGNGIIFVVTRHAYHGFDSFEGIRKAIQINFEKTSLFSKIVSRYDDR
jgi:SM-20-related protein